MNTAKKINDEVILIESPSRGVRIICIGDCYILQSKKFNMDTKMFSWVEIQSFDDKISAIDAAVMGYL